MVTEHILAYLRFLNIIRASNVNKNFPNLDPAEARLLDAFADLWFNNKRVTVSTAMHLMDTEMSPATVHRRIQGLRKKGMLELDNDDLDSRIRYVVATDLAKQYFHTLGQALNKAHVGAVKK